LMSVAQRGAKLLTRQAIQTLFPVCRTCGLNVKARFPGESGSHDQRLLNL
jgi:hypothetical protein